MDDEVLIRMIMADELRDAGYQVIEASSADEGLALLSAGVSVDLMITDVRMPGDLDGLALAKAARRLRPELAIIVSSGHVRSADSDLAGVVDAYLPKPYLPVQLIEMARGLLADAS
ncbi:response regulator [Sphingosinicellaceae bacterium]|nr:response regulator [Sphingosinicellaceae bacterium]